MNKIIIFVFLVLSLASCFDSTPKLEPGSVGNLIVETPDEDKRPLTEEEQIMKLQQEEKERQQRDVEDLERQEYHNSKIRKYGLEE